MLRVCTKMVNRRLQLCVIKPVHWGYTYPQNIHIFVKWAACSIAENVQCSSGEHIITVMRHTVCTASGTCVREVCMCERGRSEWPCGLRHGSRPLVFWEWEFESRRGQVCHVFWVLCVCVCVCVASWISPQQADNSSRGVLPSVVCLRVIEELHRGGLGPLGAVET